MSEQRWYLRIHWNGGAREDTYGWYAALADAEEARQLRQACLDGRGHRARVEVAPVLTLADLDAQEGVAP